MAEAFVDDMAEESDKEEDDKEHDEDDEDEDEDEDDNEYKKDDFVVSDDEDEGGGPRRINEDELADFGEAPEEKEDEDEPKLRRLRRNKEQVDEDDLMLVQEAEEQQGTRSVKAKDIQELESRLFDDDDVEINEEKTKRKIIDSTTNDDYFDEDNLDDFIEDDLGDTGGQNDDPQQRKRKRRSSHHEAGGGISQLGMQDMMEIFGPEVDEEDDEFFEIVEPTAAGRQHQMFEQRELQTHFISEYDDQIRNADLPERLNLRPIAVRLRTAQDLDKDLEAETTFCLFRRGLKDEKTSDDNQSANRLAVRNTLELINKALLEVPCIQYYRRDYLVNSDLALPQDLWGIADLDIIWAHARHLRTKLQIAMDQHLEETQDLDDPDTEARREFLEAVRYDLREWSADDEDAHDPDALLCPVKDLLVSLRRLVFKRSADTTTKKPRTTATDTEDKARKYGHAFTLRPLYVQAKLAGDTTYTIPPIPTPNEPPEMLAIDFFENDDARRRAIQVLARDLASVPALRRLVRRSYRAVCVLNTRPTPQGKLEIDVAHEFSGLQHIRGKPIRDILCCGDEHNPRQAEALYLNNPAEDFAYLLKAEREGLIEISLAALNIENDAAAFSPKIADRFKLELMAQVAPDDTSTTTKSTSILDTYLKPNPENALDQVWNEERRLIVLTAMEKFLLPQFEEEIKRLLRKQAEIAIARAAASQLRRRIDLAPVGRDPQDLSLGTSRDTIGGCTMIVFALDDAAQSRDQRSMVAAVVSNIGLVIDTASLSPHASDRDINAINTLVELFLKYRPPALFFASGIGGKACHRLERLCTNALGRTKARADELIQSYLHERDTMDDYSREEVLAQFNLKFDADLEDLDISNWHPFISPAEDSLARAFAYSQRGQNEFPNDSPAMRVCVSIAREAQNAVSEFASCWTTASDDRIIWGDDILKCKFHPLVDDYATGTTLMAEYERVMQDMVAKVGLDLEHCLNHDHHFGLLIFAPGLGIRKAFHLRRKARQLIARSRDGVVTGRRELAELVAPYIDEDEDSDEDEGEEKDDMDIEKKDVELISEKKEDPETKKEEEEDNNDDESLNTPKELADIPPDTSSSTQKKKKKKKKKKQQNSGSTIFTNLAGFVRFNPAGGAVGLSGDHDELDGTRIHPECYLNMAELGARDFAQRICADALDTEHYSHEDYADVIERAMQDSHDCLKRVLDDARFKDISKQPRNDPRPQPFGFPYWRTPLRPETDDDIIGDSIGLLDIDAYANMIKEEGRHYREQLEDIKRELRWPWREARPMWQPPSRETCFEWYAGRGAAAASKIAYDTIRSGQATLASPRHQFLALRPYQIVTCRVQSADDFRLYVDIADVPGMRGSIERKYILEDTQEDMAKNESVLNIQEAINMSVRNGRVNAPKFLRLDDDDVFEAAVLRINFDRMRIELSRSDHHVFFPMTKAAFDQNLIEEPIDAHQDRDAMKSASNNVARLYGDEVVALQKTDGTEGQTELKRKDLIDPHLEENRVGADYMQLAESKRSRALSARDQRRKPGQQLDLEAAVKNEIKHQRIVHPNFLPKANSFQLAESELAKRPEGDAIFRPSSQKGRLTLSWALLPGLVRHIPIEDIEDEEDETDGAGGRRYDTRGRLIQKKQTKNSSAAQYRIGKSTFEELDEILALYIFPMNDLIANTITHRKYDTEVSSDEKNPKRKVQAKLAQKRQENPMQLQYVVWLDATHPGYLVLSWLPEQGNNTMHEYMECTPKGWKLRDRYCDNVEVAIGYFKKNVKSWLAKASAQKKKAATAPPTHQPSSNPQPPASDLRRVHRHPAAHDQYANAENRYASPAYNQSPAYQSPSYNTYQSPNYEYNPQQPPQPYQQYPPQGGPPGNYQPPPGGPPPPQRGPPPPQRGPPPPQRGPPPPRGPVGRGRSMTLPAWQTQQQQHQY